jgi:hypothetical protein
MPDYGRAFLMQAYVVMVVVLKEQGESQRQCRIVTSSGGVWFAPISTGVRVKESNNPIFRLPLEEKGEET